MGCLIKQIITNVTQPWNRPGDLVILSPAILFRPAILFTIIRMFMYFYTHLRFFLHMFTGFYMRLDQMAIGLNYLNTLKLQWPFYIAIFVNGHFIFMNEVPGHFINREMAIGCCTELLEYTDIVMAFPYWYLCRCPFYE